MSQLFKTPITSDVPNGVAPFVIASFTEVANLNVQYVGGYSAAELLDRAEHTGTQAASTVSVTPAGNLAASNVADALTEHQGDIDNLAAGMCDGRLTTESGVAISTTNRQSQSTIYFTPFNGNRLGLYDGTRWVPHTFSERSLALSGLTSGLPYDVYIYNNAGTITLELTAWTNGTTRATALAIQDGVYVKTGATTRRWLGTIYTTSTTTTEDSAGAGGSYGGKRYVYNHYNRVPRRCFITYTTSHTQTAGTGTRQLNADAIAQIDMVLGHDQNIQFNLQAIISSHVGTVPVAVVSLGIDSTSGENVSTYTPMLAEHSASASRSQPIAAGKHFVSLNQRTTTANATFLTCVLDSFIFC